MYKALNRSAFAPVTREAVVPARSVEQDPLSSTFEAGPPPALPDLQLVANSGDPIVDNTGNPVFSNPLPLLDGVITRAGNQLIDRSGAAVVAGNSFVLSGTGDYVVDNSGIEVIAA